MAQIGKKAPQRLDMLGLLVNMLGRKLLFEFSDSKRAINEYLEVRYYVTFPWTNYESKKGISQTNTVTCPIALKRHTTTFLPKQSSLPKCLKLDVVHIYADL
jgi:hypothetical protein